MTDGPGWSASRARAEPSELEEWLAFALRRVTRRTARARAVPARPRVEPQARPDPTSPPRTRRSSGSSASGSPTGTPVTGWWARSTARQAGRGSANAGTSIRSTAPTTSCAAFRSSARSSRSSGTARFRWAMMSAPALGERWWASRGGGAWVRGGPANPAEPRQVRVSTVDALEDRRSCYGPFATWRRRGSAGGFVRSDPPDLARTGIRGLLGLHAHRRRRCRSDGRAGADPWDLAAPSDPHRGGRRTDHRLRRPPKSRARRGPRDERTPPRGGVVGPDRDLNRLRAWAGSGGASLISDASAGVGLRASHTPTRRSPREGRGRR